VKNSDTVLVNAPFGLYVVTGADESVILLKEYKNQAYLLAKTGRGRMIVRRAYYGA
jgi:hypothetical protein